MSLFKNKKEEPEEKEINILNLAFVKEENVKYIAECFL